MLLTRDEFKKQVFARDGNKCVICGKVPSKTVLDARHVLEITLDAHHIYDRSLFVDQGYYIENGVTLCSANSGDSCHLQAELGNITYEQLRIAAGIDKLKPIISFRRVKEPFGWFSNMSPHPITEIHSFPFENKIWHTAEALFQALRFNNQEIIKEIHQQKNPMAAKMTAKKYAKDMIVAPRSPQDVENMRMVLKLKLHQHNLKQQLLDTGDAVIIEDCTNRQNESGLFWGAAFKYNKWYGENVLGKLWMELREQ